MYMAERYHRGLKRVAVVLGAVNLLSIFTLDQREWLVYFDPYLVAGFVFPAFVIGLPSLAFLVSTRLAAQAKISTVAWLALATLALIAFELLWISQIAVAMFFRGPDWNFYWPGEERVPKIVPLNTFDLSEYVWNHLAGQPRPANPLVRESVGLSLLALHLLLVPAVAATLLRRVTPQMTWRRIFLFWLVLQALNLTPLKIFLRWVCNCKYLVTFPEWMLNV